MNVIVVIFLNLLFLSQCFAIENNNNSRPEIENKIGHLVAIGDCDKAWNELIGMDPGQDSLLAYELSRAVYFYRIEPNMRKERFLGKYFPYILIYNFNSIFFEKIDSEAEKKEQINYFKKLLEQIKLANNKDINEVTACYGEGKRRDVCLNNTKMHINTPDFKEVLSELKAEPSWLLGGRAFCTPVDELWYGLPE